MTSRRKTVPGWRQFEELVARIEKLAAPADVVVRSPDRVRSNITGKLREVDATLRATLGTATILVTIECRKRRPKQDVTWVEQLVTKREAIGAARTIAVSPTGFSEQARAVAQHYGIELRVLSEIQPSELEGWLPRFASFVHIYNHCSLRRVSVSVLPLTPADPELEERWEREGFAQHTINDEIFVKPDGSRATLESLWLEAQDAHDYYAGLEPGGESKLETVRLVTPEDRIDLRIADMARRVGTVDLELELGKRVEEIPVKDARILNYQAAGGRKLQRIEIETREARTNVRAAVQSSFSDDKLHVSAELIDPDKSLVRSEDAG